MCPRATAQHCGVAMASVCSFVEEEYIDLDLSSCGEFEFRVRRSGGAADELLCRGRLAAAAPPHKAAPRTGGKVLEVDAGSGGCGGAGRRSAATVAPLQHSHSAGFRDAQSPVVRLRKEGSQRRKAARTVHAKLLASRAFFRSLFARTSCSDEQCRGAGVRPRARATPSGEAKSSSCCKAPSGQLRNGYHSGSDRAAPTTLRSSIEQEKLMDEEELAAAAVRQRKSFSGVIKWRHGVTTPAAAAPAKPLSSSSARRSSGAGGGGGPALKRSSSARSESEGLIQGAIAYCKRSQQQLGLTRKSVSDAALCSCPSSWHLDPYQPPPSSPPRRPPRRRHGVLPRLPLPLQRLHLPVRAVQLRPAPVVRPVRQIHPPPVAPGERPHPPAHGGGGVRLPPVPRVPPHRPLLVLLL